MERLTSAGSKKSGLILHLVLLAVALSGPHVVPRIISGFTSLVTWPLTQDLRFVDNRFEIFNTEILMLYLIAVLGLSILMQSGLMSIGHSALFGLGAYVVAIATVNHGWSFWVALPVAGLITGVVGLILGFPALRLGLFTLAMVTVGYAFVFEDLAIELRGFTGGADGLRGVKFPSAFGDLESFYWLVMIVTILAYAFSHNLIRSPFGRRSVAIEENPVAAQSLGISLYATKLQTFALSSVFAGVAGGLFAPLVTFVAPDSFTVNLAILLLLMVLVGGTGTVLGPLVGTVLLFRIPLEVERIVDQPGEVTLLVYGVVLLASVHLFPRGLMGAWWFIKSRFGGRRTPTELTERASPEVSRVIAPIDQSETAVLVAQGVVKNLGGVQALDGIDLSVESGTVHALIGPNGSGKTTFLNTISGYLQADEGSMFLFDREAGEDAAHIRAGAGLGRTFQTPFVFEGISCLENVMAALDQHRKQNLFAYMVRWPGARREERRRYHLALEILDAVGLRERADTAASALPPGERRLLELARVLGLQPSLVLMDEPAAGLTSGEIDELEEVIIGFRDAGIGVLLVEHHVEFVLGLADVVTVIDFGQVIARGTPDEVRDDPNVITAYLGEEDHDDALEHRMAGEPDPEKRP